MATPKEVVSDIVARYSFVLNTPECRGKNMTGEEFAKRIAEVFDCTEHVHEYATVIAQDYIANIRHEHSGRVAWKFN